MQAMGRAVQVQECSQPNANNVLTAEYEQFLDRIRITTRFLRFSKILPPVRQPGALYRSGGRGTFCDRLANARGWLAKEPGESNAGIMLTESPFEDYQDY